MCTITRSKLPQYDPLCVLAVQNEPGACCGSKTRRVYRPLQVPFSLSLLLLLVLSHNVFKKKKRRKEKSNKQQTTNCSDRRGGEISLECRGMSEKGTHRVLARDYFSDSWLVRFWQFLAYFSNKDYRNYETVLSETTRTKLGTRRLWISFFFLKLLNVDVYFHLWTRRTRKVQEKVHPRCTFSSPMPGQKARIKSLLIF